MKMVSTYNGKRCGFINISLADAIFIIKYKNLGNRRKRLMAAAQYSTDMENKTWYVTNQGLAFDKDGNLLDGQNRLIAQIVSKTDQVYSATFGMTKEEVLAIDANARRNPADQITMDGCPCSNTSVAAAKAMAIAPSPIRLLWTNASTKRFVVSNKDALDFAVASLGNGKKRRHITKAGFLALIARAYYHVPLDRLARFSEVLFSGICGNKHEEGIIKLRNYAINVGSMTRADISGDSKVMTLYKKAQFVLNAFIKGAPVVQLRSLEDDIYPLPEQHKAEAMDTLRSCSDVRAILQEVLGTDIIDGLKDTKKETETVVVTPTESPAVTKKHKYTLIGGDV
jgi:hypothetical protein